MSIIPITETNGIDRTGAGDEMVLEVISETVFIPDGSLTAYGRKPAHEVTFARPLAMCPEDTITARGSARRRQEFVREALLPVNKDTTPRIDHSATGYTHIIQIPLIQPEAAEIPAYSAKLAGIRRNMDCAVLHSLHNSPVTNPETIMIKMVTGHDANGSRVLAG